MKAADVVWPDEEELREMQGLASRAWLEGAPINSEATVGQLAWSNRRPTSHSRWHLLYPGGELGAWARVTLPQMVRVSSDRAEISDAALAWQTAPEHVDLVDAIFDWALEEATFVTTSVRREDASAFAFLRGRVSPVPGAAWSTFNVRPLDQPVEAPLLPDGFRLSTYAETRDDRGRIDVHRLSWDSTTFTAEALDRLRTTWPYRADLDVFVLGPGGSPVCSVLAWFDDTAGLGELEPVGTHPQYRRMGLARAASLHAMRLLRDAGATHAAVACRGDDGYPAPWRLYESVGFKRVYNDLPVLATRRDDPRSG